MKPGTQLEYVHVNSNHPRHVTKHAVAETSKRLSNLSSNEAIFEAAKGPYEEALRRAGHKEKLSYQPTARPAQKKKRRRRHTIWYNPPYCSSMTTKLGQIFLSILDECFPVGHRLRRVLNRHTVQLSYRTMPSLSKIIAGHNAKVVANNGEELPVQRPFNSNCNCRGGTTKCPMEDARCKDASVLYQATVEEEGKPDQTYTGVAATSWKIRYGNHKSNFTHSAQRVKSSLAGHIWKLKDEGRQYALKWRTLARLPTYNPSTNSCRLCLCEKYTIMFKPELASLNQRDEFFTHCRHREAKLLDKT